MYIAAALIVERISGIPYIDFVQEKIIGPLGLRSTTYNGTAAELEGHLAEGFALLQTNASDGEGWTKSVHRPTSLFLSPEIRPVIAGAGGVLSSAKDIVRSLPIYPDFSY